MIRETSHYLPVAEPIPLDSFKTFFAVVNPVSGSGTAVEMFRSIIEPIWKKYSIKYQVLITNGPNHCEEVIKNIKNIVEYTLIAVGGDGTLSKIFAGLRGHLWVSDAISKVTVGIIPGGSGNGLPMSLVYYAKRPFSIKNATLITVPNISIPIDLAYVTQNDQSEFAFLSIGMGLIPEIDTGSDFLRWLGSCRFTLWAIVCILEKKVYPAKFSYLPDDITDESLLVLPPLDSPLPEQFVTITGNFYTVMAYNTTHSGTMAFTAPKARFDDGFLHGFYIQEMTTWEMIQFLWGLEDGTHMDLPCVIPFKTKAFRLEMLSNDAKVTVDGELRPPQPIQCSVHQAAAKVLCG
jgi:sphingosine kinase